ncbi:MAG: Lrp/AsnC ligand binding domain-containing protein [Halobacteriales archaeon]|nr:Lrp/AsnC ligand binding domain-containing protein [Halobacteriales archaeon]
MRAFVLIKCEVDSVLSAVEEMEAIEDVIRVDAVTGKYDAVTEIDASDTDDLRNVVAGEIHSIDGVAETTTCIAT